MTDSITIALSKGRILEETLPLLAEAGIELVDDVKKSRKLVFPTTDPDVRVLIIRATDVPTYVQYGGADLGVTGKDVLMEHGAEGLYEPLDLNISRCSLMTAGPKGQTPPNGRIKVATKFVAIAPAGIGNALIFFLQPIQPSCRQFRVGLHGQFLHDRAKHGPHAVVERLIHVTELQRDVIAAFDVVEH